METEMSEKDQTNPDINSINYQRQLVDRDVHRTMSNNIKFESTLSDHGNNHQKEENAYLISLRRILIAFVYYSWQDPNSMVYLERTCAYTVGYAQGLNFIVAWLLFVFTHGQDYETLSKREQFLVEEKVFWMLAIIVDRILPKDVN